MADPRTTPEEAPVEHDEVLAAAERDQQRHTVRVDTGFTQRLVAAVRGPSVRVTVLALITAVVLGGIIIAVSDPQARGSLAYLTARPSDFLTLGWDAVRDAYTALLRGAVGSPRALSESGLAAIPLILAGLAVTVPFRAGMFNIGGEGQLIAGGVAAAFVGFTVTGLPMVVHLPLAVLAGVAAGTAYGFVPGILKARTGAHEVIVTIMLNNIALLVTDWLLTTRTFLPPGQSNPQSKDVLPSALLPRFSSGLRLNVGIIVALLVAAAIWWVLQRSTFGFELQAVGLNPNAATGAGMSVTKMTVMGMSLAGALAGLAGAMLVLGSSPRITGGFSAGLGFDGITVALLGRGSVGGTVAAGLLFGGLKAGGRTMQAQAQTPLDLITVVQALIIVFIAAPALVRAIYRVRADEPAVATQVSAGWGA